MKLTEALQDIEITFLQFEFCIKLLGYCEEEKIDPLVFDTDEVVLLETESLYFPQGRFSTNEDIVKAASVSVSLALGSTALTLDKAWEVAGICPNPDSEDETVKLRTLVYLVRCAYAHGVAEPKWRATRKYRRVLKVELPDGPSITLDLRDLNGQVVDFSVLGGHAIWFDIRDATIATLKRS